jgi:hypothetical protein
LRTGVDGIEPEDRVPVDGRGKRAEQAVLGRFRRLAHPALDPHLIGRRAPAREHAHAVAAPLDRVEVLEQCVPAESLEHALAHVVGGFDVEREARDRAQRAQADDEAVEVGIASTGRDDRAVRRDELQRGDRGREVPVSVARAVCGGRDGAADGDVRQRCEVVQRQAVAVQRPGELAVAHARTERDRVLGVVDDHGRAAHRVPATRPSPRSR